MKRSTWLPIQHVQHRKLGGTYEISHQLPTLLITHQVGNPMTHTENWQLGASFHIMLPIRHDSLRSGGQYLARARFPGPKTNQSFARLQNHGLRGFCYAKNLHSKSILREFSRELGKLGREGTKLTVSFEDNIRFIHVRRCRAERGKGVFERPAEDLLINARSILYDCEQVF
ncbi:hypothetical protein TNCV_1390471 [Trichonephila clavipes]|nr:hypothetical protein TNCV_1390471 [Trichonephila clavipes]